MRIDSGGLETEEGRYGRVDRNSLFLLLLLTVPAGLMAVVLYLWPEVLWISSVPHGMIGLLGSFASLLLAVFVIAQYGEQRGILYASAGLLAMGILGMANTVAPEGSSGVVWVHTFAGVIGGSFFLFYALARTTRLGIPHLTTDALPTGLLLGAAAAVAAAAGLVPLAFAGALPALPPPGEFSPFRWVIVALPASLFLTAGTVIFCRYRKTGEHELFLFTAVLIFLFQASEVYSFAPQWGVIWWFWQAMRLVVYLGVLGYILRKYLQTHRALAAEVEESQRMGQALHTSQENWRNSFNALEEVMMIIDRASNIESLNSSGLALLGKSQDEAVGAKCYQVVHRRTEPCPDCPLQRTLESRKVESVERYHELFKRHFSVKSSPVLDESGEVARCVYTMNDITERVNAAAKEKMLQRELSLTSRLASIGEVAAGIAHEINNPLTGVIAFAQMLMQMDIPQNMREGIEVIHDGASRVVGIVGKLLTFARRGRKSKEFTDISDILTNTLAIRSYEMRNNNVEVVTTLLDNLPRTMVNVGQLQQVFLNIIVNAEQAIATATGRGANGRGVISVRTETVDGRIRVSIADDGPGITEDVMDKLFDPFFTTKTETGGTGLGLSISFGIIKEHGGRIYARSVPGNGATFVIELPIVEAGWEADEPSVIPEAEPATVASARILVVDDEPHICRALDRLLTREGHRVDTAGSARTALRKLTRAEYDLILLDLRMPEMTGIEFYERLKKVAPALRQRTICVTGDVISARNRAFLSDSGIPCVAKPFGVDELMSQVKQILGGGAENAQVTYSSG
ncbi:MAG: ATP-binding protein [Dehalococcoidales bacterium]